MVSREERGGAAELRPFYRHSGNSRLGVVTVAGGGDVGGPADAHCDTGGAGGVFAGGVCDGAGLGVRGNYGGGAGGAGVQLGDGAITIAGKQLILKGETAPVSRDHDPELPYIPPEPRFDRSRPSAGHAGLVGELPRRLSDL